MSYVQIGNEQRPLDDASEQWISEQLRRRKQDGASTCVQVALKQGPLDMVLSTGDCPKSSGGGRAPNPQERDIFDLWQERGLDNRDFHVGNLIAFLRQLQRSL